MVSLGPHRNSKFKTSMRIEFGATARGKVQNIRRSLFLPFNSVNAQTSYGSTLKYLDQVVAYMNARSRYCIDTVSIQHKGRMRRDWSSCYFMHGPIIPASLLRWLSFHQSRPSLLSSQRACKRNSTASVFLKDSRICETLQSPSVQRKTCKPPVCYLSLHWLCDVVWPKTTKSGRKPSEVSLRSVNHSKSPACQFRIATIISQYLLWKQNEKNAPKCHLDLAQQAPRCNVKRTSYPTNFGPELSKSQTPAKLT